MKIKITKDHEKLKDKQRSWASFVNSLSGFKSVNLIGSKSKSGQVNLSVISSLVHLGSNPPLMGFVIRPHSEDSPRHSLENILETKYFTLNHVSKDFYKKAHQTSARYPKDVSEFLAVGLEPEYIDNFNAPYVKESLVQMGLKLRSEYFIKENKTHFIVAEIENIYTLDDAILNDGSLNIEDLNTVALSGLDTYHSTSKISKLSYAKTNKKIEEL
jgi:flavin reductase (DIM6/NTAB) family NADH-FMN oxidoreductase RutF